MKAKRKKSLHLSHDKLRIIFNQMIFISRFIFLDLITFLVWSYFYILVDVANYEESLKSWKEIFERVKTNI